MSGRTRGHPLRFASPLHYLQAIKAVSVASDTSAAIDWRLSLLEGQ
ncbi:MAG: hypothetical protein MUE44_07870 [Oscillatoriaceae cyanobacterium Prado104]|nr:hypothetical protein [Oscillatoriaceae cyanobacterium Prado104]